jgi:RNA polymerase sigma factor (sigma-70 family)
MCLDLLPMLRTAREGDQAAEKQLMIALSEKLRKVAPKIVQHAHDADDSVQNALLNLWMRLNRKRLPNFDSNEGFLSYLLVMLRREHLQILRKSKFCSGWFDSTDDAFSQLLDPLGSMGNEEVDFDDDTGFLLEAIGQIPADDQRLVHMHYTMGMTYVEISTILGPKPGTIRARMFEIRKRLQVIIKRIAPAMAERWNW